MAGEERWTAIEDVGRLRDGLGVPVPPGTPDAFTDPVEDPLADLVARYARTHGPFTTDQVADRLGLGAAVVRHTLQRLAAARPGARRASSGPPAPAPSGATPRCCAGCAAARWPGCARRSSRSSPRRWAASCAAWQHVGPATGGRGGLRGVDGVLTAIDQLAGCSGAGLAPSSRWCWPPGCATTSRRTSTS